MTKSILGLAFISALALFSLFQGPVLATTYTCYNDGTTAFCSSAVLDYEVWGSYSTSAECAANCGY
ncbi:MAG: hypothetical protein ACJ763_10875 [Bdellovibrionia bacterium]